MTADLASGRARHAGGPAAHPAGGPGGGARDGEPAGGMDDARLAAAIRRDPDLFTLVYDRYFRDVYRYAAGRLDTQAGEDIAAETFCTAFATRDRFDPERGGLRPWLFGIATNLIARHRRQEARHYRALSRSGAQPAEGSHENGVLTAVAARRMRPELASALASLNQGERDVLLLLALAQLGHDEIAEALGISYGTVGSRLSRARRKLGKALDKEKFHG
ncbi:RNA polymerase sigma factor [Actinomadura rupiterrae]|uniref:RNA polymerase sigma factor n=1 Tax=Actinomadura rupiterrae TaxID=559627 RepID=UPI0020A26288|nr:RNA polymerase sigma factor [Actinomadura rupiterrae]MCP2341463.1 RNA polymerase sigma-70 factor (ECF subfamily) [Actinomadura rupiterrae]